MCFEKKIKLYTEDFIVHKKAVNYRNWNQYDVFLIKEFKRFLDWELFPSLNYMLNFSSVAYYFWKTKIFQNRDLNINV